jgi:hypothetical protein
VSSSPVLIFSEKGTRKLQMQNNRRASGSKKVTTGEIGAGEKVQGKGEIAGGRT